MDTQRDDSQISLRIATATAAFSVVGFLTYTILVDSLHVFSVLPFGEIIIKSLIVVISLIFANPRVRESFALQNYSQIPFLSTVFFYCVSLLILYVGQILFVVFHLFVSTGVSLLSELKFILGISDFSVFGIMNSLLAGHVPYLVYFFFLKYQLRNR